MTSSCESIQQLEWFPVTGALISQEKECQIFELLENQQSKSLNQQVKPMISLKKQLNQEGQKKWSWHKSWNLPDIEYRINSGITPNEDDNNGLYVEVFVVLKQDKSNQYISLGIKGTSKQKVTGNSVIFKCLKFTTTSYNNQHKNLQLLVVLTSQYKDQNQIVLNARISEEIYVDSRKFARFHYHKVQERTFIDMFFPELVDQNLIKRENRNKQISITKIENNINGFINYFTASNIRNKIKHPLFLAFKFSNPVKLYLSNSLVKKKESDIITSIQTHLQYLQDGKKDEKQIKLLINIQAENKLTSKKALEIIQELENNCYEIYTQSCYIPNGSILIQDIQDLIQNYKDNFNQVKQQKYNENEDIYIPDIIKQIRIENNSSEKQQNIHLNSIKQSINNNNNNNNDDNNQKECKFEEKEQIASRNQAIFSHIPIIQDISQQIQQNTYMYDNRYFNQQQQMNLVPQINQFEAWYNLPYYCYPFYHYQR